MRKSKIDIDKELDIISGLFSEIEQRQKKIADMLKEEKHTTTILFDDNFFTNENMKEQFYGRN